MKITTDKISRALPVFLKMVHNQGETGLEACGYIENDYSKGIKTILNAFSDS